MPKAPPWNDELFQRAEEELGARQRAAETKRLRTREALITAAVDLVTRDGRSYRIQDITEAAGVSPATFYNHFNSKTQLIKAAYERLMAPVTEPTIDAGWAGTYTPSNRDAELVRYIEEVAARASNHRALTQELVRTWTDDQLSKQDDLIAPRLVDALMAIVRPPANPQHFGVRPRARRPSDTEGKIIRATCAYHLHMLLVRACQSDRPSAASANEVLGQLVPVIRGHWAQAAKATRSVAP